FTSQGVGDEAERWVREHNDKRFLEATLAADADELVARGVSERSACCPGAVAAALAAARESGAAPEPALLRYATSREIHRSPSFVGYAGIVF
ncbi:MAG: AmmeMemoRadiSam system protein B, partial [Myxococcales bacterium]|nr:AmmeMemoRadiSam system protein B [Myxococcales bacterium]